MQATNNEQLIVALDVPSADDALRLVATIGDAATFYKVGMQLYFAAGNAVIQALQKENKKIFLDLKINDIPETVAKAVESLAHLGVDYLTLFTGAAQLRAARNALEKTGSRLKLLNVTVLTSDASDFAQVRSRAALSLDAGAHGLICSGLETAALRAEFGDSPLFVNPGIRPRGASTNDQIRIVTPEAAIRAGASNIVVGRPITRDENPRACALRIQDEIFAARRASAPK